MPHGKDGLRCQFIYPSRLTLPLVTICTQTHIFRGLESCRGYVAFSLLRVPTLLGTLAMGMLLICGDSNAAKSSNR
jgi:hypothetical protein